jgi:hypothetical protein
MTTTWTGTQILERMTDTNFQTWVKWLITVIGLIYFWRALAGYGLL